ncbi:hypothetical protein [Spiroplasma clarkii]|nr:hypothetical protein [Spiroplasma clarkii]
MQSLYQTQAELLSHAFGLLNDNGKLLYATCTINKAENQNLITSFLKKEPTASLLSEEQYFGFESNNNGFYLALISKKL